MLENLHQELSKPLPDLAIVKGMAEIANELIADGQFEKAIFRVREFTEIYHSGYRDEVNHLSGRWESLSKQERIGVLEFSEANRCRDQITRDLQEIIRKILASFESPTPVSELLKNVVFDIDADYISRSVVEAYTQSKSDSSERSSLFEVVISQRLVVLLGEAGMGKSTELEYMNNALGETGWVVRHRRFRDFGTNPIGIDFPDQEFPKTALILDGLDETDVQGAKIAIEAFVRTYSHTHVIVSCRANIFLPSTLDAFRVFHLQRLNWQEIREFVEKQLSTRSQHFLSLFASRDHYELLFNPFFLRRLIDYYRDNKFQAPSSKTVLLDYLIKKALDQRLQQLERSSNKLRQECLQSLEKLAFVMECLGENVIEDSDFEQLMSDETERLFVLKKSSLIEWRNGKWAFAHRNFQEYLAACVLFKIKNSSTLREILGTKPSHDKISNVWTNTLAYFSELIKDQADIYRPILDWMMRDNPEIVVNFEPSLFPRTARLEFLNAQLRYHEEHCIVMGYALVPKMADFIKEVPGIAEILIEEFKPSKTWHGRLSAVRLMEESEPSKFVLYKEKLLPHLEKGILDFSDSETFMPGACLKILSSVYTPSDIPQTLMDEIGNRLPDFKRADARNLIVGHIHRQRLQGRYLEPLLKMLKNLADPDFKTESTYPDEKGTLLSCLEAIEGEELMFRFFHLYSSFFPDPLKFYDFKSPFPEVLRKSADLPLAEREAIIDVAGKTILYYADDLHGSSLWMEKANYFISQPGTDLALIKYCLANKEFDILYYLGKYMTAATISIVVEDWIAKGQTAVEFQGLVNAVTRFHPDLSPLLVKAINFRLGTNLSIPIFEPIEPRIRRRHDGDEQKRTEWILEPFFYLEKFKTVIAEIYRETGQEYLNKAYLLHPDNKHFDSLYNKYASEWIRSLHFTEPTSLVQFFERLEKNWDVYSHNRIFSIIIQAINYQITPEQSVFLRDWCDRYAKTFDPKRKEYPGGKVTADADSRFVYYTLRLGFMHYPEGIYVKMLGKNFENGFVVGAYPRGLIEYLRENNLVELGKLKTLVVRHLHELPLNSTELYHYQMFANYCNLAEALPIFQQYLRKQRENWGHLCMVYHELGGSKEFFVQLLEEGILTKDNERQLINDLVDSTPAGFEHWLETAFKSSADPSRSVFLAMKLLLLGNEMGFQYIIEYIRENHYLPEYDIAVPKSYPHIHTLPFILQLYESAFLPENTEHNQSGIRRFADHLLQNLTSANNWQHYSTVKATLLESIEQNKPRISGTQQTGDVCGHLTLLLRWLEERYAQNHRLGFEDALGIFGKI